MADPYRVLSYGGGVQSSALLFAACHGDTPDGIRPDIAIFSDTQWEPSGVMQYIDEATRYAARYGIRVLTTTYGSIRSPHGSSVMPMFVTGEDGEGGITPRQCTDRYKIRPLRKALRSHLGYQRGQRLGHDIEMWLGISTDEAHRMKPSQETRTTHRYPLIEMGWNRQRCQSYVQKLGLPAPMKSSCIGCPYHSNRYFLDMKRERPREWVEAVAFDDQIRSDPTHFKTLHGTPYLHRSRQPLKEAYLNEDQMDLFGEECSGYCES